MIRALVVGLTGGLAFSVLWELTFYWFGLPLEVSSIAHNFTITGLPFSFLFLAIKDWRSSKRVGTST